MKIEIKNKIGIIEQIHLAMMFTGGLDYYDTCFVNKAFHSSAFDTIVKLNLKLNDFKNNRLHPLAGRRNLS